MAESIDATAQNVGEAAEDYLKAVYQLSNRPGGIGDRVQALVDKPLLLLNLESVDSSDSG